MKNLSFILLTVTILLSATSSFAGQIRSFWYQPGDTIKLLSNEEFFSKSDYIVELKPAGKEYGTFYDARGNENPDEIYTSMLFIVTEIYKTDETRSISRGDTINYIRKGGTVVIPSKDFPIEGRGIVAPEPVDYDTGEIGGATTSGYDYSSTIFFMKKSDLPENPNVSKRNKHPKVSMLQDIRRASIKIGSRTSPGGPIYGLNDLHFDNRYELYKYMEQFEGVKVPLSNPGQMHWYLFGNDAAFNQYLNERNIKWRDSNNPQVRDSLNQELEKRAKRARENTEKKKREQRLLRAAQANNTLTVSIQNQAVKYENRRYYFKFDVFVNANNFSTYLDNVVLRLNYNTTAFGTNVKANNKVTVSNGAEFNIYTYNPSNHVYDVSSNCLNLGIGVNPIANLTRTQLTTTPVKLLDVEIELLNGLTGVSSGVNFTDVANTSFFSLFATASNTSVLDAEMYDATNYTNPPGFSIYSVAPTLSSFTPTTRNAGVGETITIYGNNFGTQKGEVLFTREMDSNNSATTYLKGLDESYITSWTNTQITVKVPSFVRKGYVYSIYEQPPIGFGSGAGSGKIKVRTVRGDESAASASNLNIEYSASNFSGRRIPLLYTEPIDRVYLARLSSDCNYDVVFTLDNSFQGSSNDKVQARNAVEAVLQTWSNVLHIRLALEKNSSNNYVYAPNVTPPEPGVNYTKNVIGFVSSMPDGSPPNADMAITHDQISLGVYNQNTSDYKYFRDYGSNIYIKESGPWDYETTAGKEIDTGKKSFYNLMLHEIGHFLNLEHVNNSNDLMHYTLKATKIIDLAAIATPKPVVGATTTVEASKIINWHLRPYQLGSTSPCGPVGFYDKVSIENPEYGRTEDYGNLLLPNTYIMNPNSTANFHAKFVSGGNPITHPVTFDWLMVLYRLDGTEYVYAQQNNVYTNTYNPNDFTGGCFWQFNTGSLPAYDWLYDSSGNIYGKVRVVVHIDDGDTQYDIADIGVVPPINGPHTVCCDGSEFTLRNPPPGTIYWTVSDNSIFTVNSTGNPTIVTRIGTGTNSVTLSARAGSTNGTVLAIKTITPCPTTTIFANQIVTTNTPIINDCGDINVQDVTVTNGATLELNSTGRTRIEGDFKVESGSGLSIE